VEYQLLIGGEWTGSGDSLDVKNKYDGSTVGVLPTASREDVDRAIDAAERTEELMACLQTSGDFAKDCYASARTLRGSGKNHRRRSR
jgi:acyl-CoA reductase-like NAD-dependent aldehyde dehydrogenase